MCQRNEITENKDAIVGKVEFSPLSEKERLREIDIRVGARLMEREIFRQQYVRGILDCFSILVFVAMAVYVAFFYHGEE